MGEEVFSGRDVLERFIAIAVRRGLKRFFKADNDSVKKPINVQIREAMIEVASAEEKKQRGAIPNRNALRECYRGERQLTFDQVQLLAKVLGVPHDDLTGEKPKSFVTGANKFDEQLNAAVVSENLSDFCYLLGDEFNINAGFDRLLDALKWYHSNFGFRCPSTDPEMAVKLLSMTCRPSTPTVAFDVVKEREDSDRANKRASMTSIESCAANRVVRFLKQRFKAGRSTGLAVGMGSTVRNVLKKVLGFIKEDGIEEEATALLKIWPFVNSLDTLSPMDHTPRVFIIEDCVKAELKGLATNCVQNNPHSSDLHELPWMRENVHAFVTSVSDWSDEHSACRTHSERNKKHPHSSTKDHIVGAVQSFPFTASGPLASVAESLCNFKSLVELAKDASDSRLMLLVATMCGECEQDRVQSLQALLAQPKLRCFNSLVLGENSAKSILRGI